MLTIFTPGPQSSRECDFHSLIPMNAQRHWPKPYSDQPISFTAKQHLRSTWKYFAETSLLLCRHHNSQRH